jgi:ATP-dependent exoDNAse (exonuclease V) beta subunit
MVCKQRNADGEWLKPAGYRWAEWLDRRMEQAENRRLLYVACTRAADLLLLSGQLANHSCWLQDILAAWDLSPEGAPDEVLDRAGYSIRMLRPSDPPAVQDSEAVQPVIEVGLDKVPPLAQPLPVKGFLGVMPVTRLARQIAQAGMHFPELRPVVYRGSRESGVTRAPAYVVGRVVHRQLADWSSLTLPEVELARVLEAAAQREGLVETGLARDAAQRAWQMLARLKQDGLFDEIDRAARRYFELPFSIQTPAGLLEGVIDLLYQSQAGAWHLIDWKTEWFNEEHVLQPGAEFQAQLALYAHAVQRILGVTAQASLVYLNPRLRRRPVEADVLAEKLDELWAMMG